jgi:hypothetical protein
MQSGQTPDWELWVTELASGKRNRIFPGYGVQPGFATPITQSQRMESRLRSQGKIQRVFLICGLAPPTTALPLARFRRR